MRNLDEALARLAAHPLGGRVGSDQLRMLRLERFQLVHQAVEFGIADLGIVEHVVAVLVMADFLPQPVDLLLHIFAGWHEAIMPVRQSAVASRRSSIMSVARHMLVSTEAANRLAGRELESSPASFLPRTCITLCGLNV